MRRLLLLLSSYLLLNSVLETFEQKKLEIPTPHKCPSQHSQIFSSFFMVTFFPQKRDQFLNVQNFHITNLIVFCRQRLSRSQAPNRAMKTRKRISRMNGRGMKARAIAALQEAVPVRLRVPIGENPSAVVLGQERDTYFRNERCAQWVIAKNKAHFFKPRRCIPLLALGSANEERCCIMKRACRLKH